MLKATFDNIIVKADYKETAVNSIIIIPDQFKKRISSYDGIVISVGPNYKDGVVPGDRVVFTRGEGYSVWYKDEEYLSLQEKWILARRVNEKS